MRGPFLYWSGISFLSILVAILIAGPTTPYFMDIAFPQAGAGLQPLVGGVWFFIVAITVGALINDLDRLLLVYG